MTPEQVEALKAMFFEVYQNALIDQFGEEYLLAYPNTKTFFNSVFNFMLPQIQQMNGAVVDTTKALIAAGQDPTQDDVMAQVLAAMGI